MYMCVSRYFFAILVGCLTSSSPGQWNTSNLHPTGFVSSKAYDVRLGREVGFASNVGGTIDNYGASNAARWTHTAGSYQSWGSAGSILLATDGAQHGGVFAANAGVVQGSPTPVTVLTNWPAGFTHIQSEVRATFAGEQVGTTFVLDQANQIRYFASTWNNSSASYVDLNPSGAFVSMGTGVYIGQQVGWAGVLNQNQIHAAIWYGSAASFVDVNPAGSTESQLNDVYSGKQAGYATFSGAKQAYLWTNTAASAVSLHPSSPTITESELRGVESGRSVGYVIRNGVTRAAIWNANTAVSYQDLQQFLPVGYTGSVAEDLWTAPNGDLYVAGWAVNANGDAEAFLWTTATLPEPTTITIALAAVGGIVRRRR